LTATRPASTLRATFMAEFLTDKPAKLERAFLVGV
jgi:hypothetical protein